MITIFDFYLEEKRRTHKKIKVNQNAECTPQKTFISSNVRCQEIRAEWRTPKDLPPVSLHDYMKLAKPPMTQIRGSWVQQREPSFCPYITQVTKSRPPHPHEGQNCQEIEPRGKTKCDLFDISWANRMTQHCVLSAFQLKVFPSLECFLKDKLLS